MRKLKFTEAEWLAADQTANPVEPRVDGFGRGPEDVFSYGTSAFPAKHSHSEVGCRPPALEEASDSGILS